jgi:hypothetical protein
MPYDENHGKRLKEQEVEAWNKWREQNPKIEPQLYKVDLSKKNLQGVNLRGPADLRRANLQGANLDGADLREANFYQADFCGANLTGADCRNAQLGGTGMRKAKLKYADLRGARLFYADLSQATLTDANFSEADLRLVQGMKLDCTFIRNARFSPRASDPWSTLRRNYTGAKLLFHLLLLIVFIMPYVTKTLMWIGVNRAQEAMISTTNRMQEVARILQQEGHPTAAALDQVVTRFSTLKECLQDECKKVSVWELLIGKEGHQPYWLPYWIPYWLLTVALILYNLCRAILTWTVGPLRDEEERSGYSPPLMYNPNEPQEPPLSLGWRKGPDWLRHQMNGYGWLIWPHRVVKILFWIALSSFAIHAWTWLTIPVSLPK